MNKQSLIAIFAVSLLLITASSALITNCAESDATTSVENDQTPEFGFNDYTKISNGSIDTYLMQETVKTEDLFGNAIPENCEEFVTVKATLTLNNEIKTISIDIEVISGGEQILFFSDTVSDDGIAEENAWIYQGMVPTIKPMNVFADAYNYISYINANLPIYEKIPDASDVVLKKIKDVLAKAVVKKIALAAASAVIPGIGWAIAAISAGLAVYDVIKLMDELPEIVDLMDTEINGFKFYEDSLELRVAKRYCGSDGMIYEIEHASNVEYHNKTPGKYYIAFLLDHIPYITTMPISMDYAVAIMAAEGISELNTYTYNDIDARIVAEKASGTGVGEPDDGLHENLVIGMMHYHHAKHDHGNYPAHSFYGEPLYI